MVAGTLLSGVCSVDVPGFMVTSQLLATPVPTPGRPPLGGGCVVSQTSPTPSPSVSAWSALATVGQLSEESGTPSPSVSVGAGVPVLWSSNQSMKALLENVAFGPMWRVCAPGPIAVVRLTVRMPQALKPAGGLKVPTLLAAAVPST